MYEVVWNGVYDVDVIRPCGRNILESWVVVGGVAESFLKENIIQYLYPSVKSSIRFSGNPMTADSSSAASNGSVRKTKTNTITQTRHYAKADQPWGSANVSVTFSNHHRPSAPPTAHSKLFFSIVSPFSCFVLTSSQFISHLPRTQWVPGYPKSIDFHQVIYRRSVCWGRLDCVRGPHCATLMRVETWGRQTSNPPSTGWATHIQLLLFLTLTNCARDWDRNANTSA